MEEENMEPQSAKAWAVPPTPTHQAAPAALPVQIDDSAAIACYANFCRVNGTPEELIVDFGLNSQTAGAPSGPLKIAQRVVINYFTAKRLLAALQMSVQRHEAAFGVLETDVQKRVVPSARRNETSNSSA